MPRVGVGTDRQVVELTARFLIMEGIAIPRHHTPTWIRAVTPVGGHPNETGATLTGSDVATGTAPAIPLGIFVCDRRAHCSGVDPARIRFCGVGCTNADRYKQRDYRCQGYQASSQVRSTHKSSFVIPPCSIGVSLSWRARTRVGFRSIRQRCRSHNPSMRHLLLPSCMRVVILSPTPLVNVYYGGYGSLCH
jgi:hypothetical protein